ncbi:MAG: hypothetical protein PHS19_00105 [Eubacteriales bacterium]|nr:hypothetical protein [Eubacteriales bacterium]
MNANDLKVITGGLTSEINNYSRNFESAYVTDTRLIGVLAVYAHWKMDEGPCREFHQFFYIDCEEAGLETCTSIRGEFGEEARQMEQSLIGGLGASRISLSEKEFRWLMNHWKDFNRKQNLPLPAGIGEYGFIFDNHAKLSQKEETHLLDRLCVIITSDYQAVNYFLMRCFSRDYEAASRLTNPDYDFPLDIYDAYVKATFCKNTIDIEKEYGDGSIAYLCESVIEMDGRHEIVVSKVVVRNFEIIGFEHCSGFEISSAEAAMMLRKEEFISVYEVMVDEDVLEENLGEFTLGLNTIMTEHESGRMFMAFKKTNDHVKERIFMLSNDVSGVYFLTDFGQLIVMSNTEAGIRRLEAKIAANPLHPYLLLTHRFEFTQPVLFEFINSGFEDFDDFLNFLN